MFIAVDGEPSGGYWGGLAALTTTNTISSNPFIPRYAHSLIKDKAYAINQIASSTTSKKTTEWLERDCPGQVSPAELQGALFGFHEVAVECM